MSITFWSMVEAELPHRFEPVQCLLVTVSPVVVKSVIFTEAVPQWIDEYLVETKGQGSYVELS